MFDISLHILDIAQNSIEAGADKIIISIDEISEDEIKISVSDNGCGMTEKQLEKSVLPNFTTKTGENRGMGLTMLKRTAENGGGSFEIRSDKGNGTTVCAVFTNKIPLGDMVSTIKCLVAANRSIDFRYTHRKCGKEFTLDTAEMKNILGDIPLDNAEVYIWLSERLSEGEGELENLNE